MIECIVRYYFKSTQGRIVRFERAVQFAAVPHAGSQLELTDDSLIVEYVIFREGAAPVLTVENATTETDAEIDTDIEEMKDRGWSVASDHKNKSRSASKI
ncbi:MAG: hypothetical protein ACRCTM_08785 [Sphaerotilus sulfidivorans]|uniref:hypothetical protein n=1 Tax=Sphaerotilus sulfidivorans TaxID=639200 RepID=UPI003F34F46E